MKYVWLLCLWSNIALFSYTDMRIVPQDISQYGINFDIANYLPFIIWNEAYLLEE